MVVRTPALTELETQAERLHGREVLDRPTPRDEAELPERYEVVNGVIQELPNMSFYSTIIMNRLLRLFGAFLAQHNMLWGNGTLK